MVATFHIAAILGTIFGFPARRIAKRRVSRNLRKEKTEKAVQKKELKTSVLRPHLEDLPDVLTVSDLRAFLPIGKNAIYEALHEQRIRNVRVRQKILIPKAAVREFLGWPVESALSSGPSSEE